MKLFASALLLFVLVVVSCNVDVGSGQISTTIDPNIPREDPANYPKNPIVSIPPVVADPADASDGAPFD
jgi:hypothetical protein